MSPGYRRSPVLFDGVVDLRFATLRKATLATLVVYPAAAVMEAYLPERSLGDAISNLLQVAALLTMFLILASRPTQLVTGDERALDEYQLHHRLKAMRAAYQLLATVLLGASAYFYFALEFGGPLPLQTETWQHITIGVILYVFILPTAFLLFGIGSTDGDEEAAEA